MNWQTLGLVCKICSFKSRGTYVYETDKWIFVKCQVFKYSTSSKWGSGPKKGVLPAFSSWALKCSVNVSVLFLSKFCPPYFMKSRAARKFLIPHQSCYCWDLFCCLYKRLVLQEKEWTWLARQQFNGIVRGPTINQLLWLNGISSKSCMSPNQ